LRTMTRSGDAGRYAAAFEPLLRLDSVPPIRPTRSIRVPVVDERAWTSP
jgi:hypothetical protein